MYTAILWKEYRQQMPMAVALMVFVVLLQISTYVLWELMVSTFQMDRSYNFLGIAVVISALYSASAAAILYSNEHEEKTYTFLRALPVPRHLLFAGKMTWLFGSATVFLLVALVESFVLSVALFPGTLQVSPGEVLGFTFGAIGGCVVLPIFWGLFWSTNMRYQMHALLATFVSASSSFWLIYAGFAGVFNPNDSRFESVFGWWIVGVFIVLSLLIGAIGIYDAYRWHELCKDKTGKLTGLLKFFSIARPMEASMSDRMVRGSTMKVRGEFAALYFHTVRQSKALFICAYAVGIAFLIVQILFLGPPEKNVPQNPLSDILMMLVIIATYCTAFAFCGSVFSADQPKRCSFFADRGVSPRKIWWSRVLAFGSVYYFFVFFGCVIFLIQYYDSSKDDIVFLLFGPGVAFIFTSVLFFSGVLVSQLCRSRIVAIVGTVVLASAISAWGFLIVTLFGTCISVDVALHYCWGQPESVSSVLWFFLNNPAFWCTVPIFLCWIIASRVRSADWLRGRALLTLRKGHRTVPLLLFGPFLLICLLIPPFRVYSVPRYDYGYTADASIHTPGFTYAVENANTPEAQYWDYFRSILVTPEENRKRIESVQAAFHDPKNANIAAKHLDFENEVVDGLVGYLCTTAQFSSPVYKEHIAALPSEEQEKIAASNYRVRGGRSDFHLDGFDEKLLQELDETIAILEELGANRVPLSERIKRQYEVQYRLVQDGKLPFHYDKNHYLRKELRWLSWRSIPWEKTRAKKRLWNRFQIACHVSEQAEGLILHGHGDRNAIQDRERDFLRRENLTSGQEGGLFDYFADSLGFYFTSNYTTENVYNQEVLRRATIIKLALVKYRVIHGEFPKTLEELKTIGYLKEIPSAPYYNEPFFYDPAPSGDEPVTMREVYHTEIESLRDHVQGTPYLWVRKLGQAYNVPNPKLTGGQIEWKGGLGKCFDIHVYTSTHAKSVPPKSFPELEVEIVR